MKNFVENGKTLVITAAADTIAGAVVIVGGVIGIAANTVTAGANLVLHTEGVYELPKATGVIDPGAKVYWDATAGKVTTTVSSNMLMGRCWNSGQVASDAAVLLVKLTPA